MVIMEGTAGALNGGLDRLKSVPVEKEYGEEG